MDFGVFVSVQAPSTGEEKMGGKGPKIWGKVRKYQILYQYNGSLFIQLSIYNIGKLRWQWKIMINGKYIYKWLSFQPVMLVFRRYIHALLVYLFLGGWFDSQLF